MALLQEKDEQLAKLQTELTNSFQTMEILANDLSAKRQKVAKQLVKQIQQEFEALKMGTMQLQLNIIPNNDKGSILSDRHGSSGTLARS